jgi:CHAT domain-containing protein
VLYEKNEKLQYLKESLRCQELSEQLYERILFNTDEEVAGLIMVDKKEKVWATNNAVSYAALLYHKTGESIYGEKALKYAEKSKMQMLQISTQKQSLQKKFDLPDSLIKNEEWLNNDIEEIENNLILQERDDKTGMSTLLLNRLAGLYESRTRLLHDIEKNYPSYYRAKFSFNVAGVNEIQQMLNDDQVILEYQLLTTEIIIFVISQNDFYIYSQPNDSKTIQAIQSLRQLLILNPIQQEAEVSFLSFINASSYLYEKLIEPVYEKIRNKHLIIIPHNELNQIPFDILISEKPKERSHSNYRNLHYLIREFPIVYAYSANLLLENKDERLKFGKGTAIFLPEYNDSTRGFQPLKGAAAEAAVIKKLSHGKIFRNGDATEDDFKSRAGRYRILHIASHTILDLQNPSLSCMVMTPEDTADDGLLYSYEISQLKLNAQLVMLSGCNTGYGLLRRSEGLISIARSFFYTGVRTIGYTLWPVADNTGYDLIHQFYKQLKRHRTLDVALRNSKLEFLQMADPVKTHPYYWASYIIVGRTDKVPLRKYPLFAQIAGMVVVTSILILVFRKANH